jgi:hypothetical protein
MNTLTRIATAFAAGATAMYFMDPLVGRRRRALVRDKGVAASHDIEHFARAKGRRAADKLHGVVAGTKAALASAPVGDAQLRERIRSRLGRIVDAPGDIEVDVVGGHVVLRGHADAAEIAELLDRVSLMRGVDSIDSHLAANESLPSQGYARMDGAAQAAQATSASNGSLRT